VDQLALAEYRYRVVREVVGGSPIGEMAERYVDPVAIVREHDNPSGTRAQGAHPPPGDLEVINPHIQVQLLRWPLVRPAGRTITIDLLEQQAPPAVGGVREVDPVGLPSSTVRSTTTIIIFDGRLSAGRN
jgi:hypothetical protein